MKKIIRLTESDLTRIVRRVIKESDGNPTMKVRIYQKFGSTEVWGNLDLYNMSLENEQVGFTFEVAGGGDISKTITIAGEEKRRTFSSGAGGYTCGNSERRIYISTDEFVDWNYKTQKKTYGNGAGDVGFLSKEGAAKIENKFCSAYSSIDNKQSDDNKYT